MRKNLTLPKRLLRAIKVEAAANGSTLQAIAGEILENYLDHEVPLVEPDTDTVTTQVTLDEVAWEQARQLAAKSGISIYRAFESSAAALGYTKAPTRA